MWQEQSESLPTALAGTSSPTTLRSSAILAQDQLAAELATAVEAREALKATAAAIMAQETEVEEWTRQVAGEEARVHQIKRALDARSKEVAELRQTYMARYRAHEERIETINARLRLMQAATQAELPSTVELTGPDMRPTLPPGAERRICPRLTVAVDVSMFSEHNFFTGLTENISEGGFFIATYDSLPLGTELNLVINLPRLPTIRVRGVVRWIRELNNYNQEVVPGMGLEFLDLAERDRAIIQQFIMQRNPLLYE